MIQAWGPLKQALKEKEILASKSRERACKTERIVWESYRNIPEHVTGMAS